MGKDRNMGCYDNPCENINEMSYELAHRNGTICINIKYKWKPSEQSRFLLRDNGWKWDRYDRIWYAPYSKENYLIALKEFEFFQQKKEVLFKRKKMIDRMPVFYQQHCGYSKDELMMLSSDEFNQVEKHGTLRAIAESIILESLPEASLAFLKEIYLLVVKNDEYREKFIKKIPKDLYYVDKRGKKHLKNTGGINDVYVNLADSSSVLATAIHTNPFWEALQLYGDGLYPINRTAYEVANYRNAYLAKENQYYKPQTRREYYLYSIIENLSLDYDDLLTRTIKNELRKEIQLTSDSQNKQVDYFLLAIYAVITRDEQQVKTLVSKYVVQKTAKEVILSHEKQIQNNKMSTENSDSVHKFETA